VSTLAQVAVGRSARVQGVAGDDELSCRLMEMGITPGVEIAVIGVAPLGDPLELELRGYRLSLRKNEAARIQVEPN
jgi:ferrous iron transport protein A